MPTVHPPPVSDPDLVSPPHVTPYFCRVVEEAAAERGLPPEPWPL